ncbi:hypothetical protein QR680_002171 [Steinernema hermaphroditum]|uniref:CCDC66 domain-containing protein n=1 Tax=Steinernema hermaphroditum TaxID=289476 RepID=A0AA39H2H3_9BILA|nr:hypothetical protein QR680_002171 [Steinernema hermaphroditum]
MVRTYAWNSSVQSNIPFSDVKTSCNSETVSESTADSGIDCTVSFVNPEHSIPDVPNQPAPAKSALEKGTTLYGVHTVRIDGQTYFQPFDCAMHQFINSQYSAAHGNRPYLQDNYLPLSHDDRSHIFRRNVEAEHLAMLAAIQSAARSQSHSAERTRKETFSAAWQKAENEEMANDPLNESFKSGHNSLPDFAYKNQINAPVNENIRRISHPEFGSFPREKKMDDTMIDELPWARGNPQPKTGVRGKSDWYVNDGYLNTSFARERLGQSQNFDVSLPPLSRFSGGSDRSWSNVLGTHISHGISRVLPRTFYDDSLPKNLYSFNQKELGTTQIEVPKPTHYGYPSQQSYETFSQGISFPTTEPAASYGDRLPNISGNLLNQSFASNPAKAEKERHKMELLQQIEDNRRRKEIEKMKEWEEDERRRIQDEMYNERQRRLLEEEQRKEKEKAAAAERKADQLAYQAAAAARNARPRRRTPVPVSPQRQRKPRTPTPDAESETETQPMPRYEEFRTNSPPVPALRNKMANMTTNETDNLPKISGSGANRSISRTSVLRK